MDSVKIFIDGIQKEVYGLFYVFDSKYYFIYTEKEVDENGYVILYMCQVGKETKNTETGPVDTGYMVGIEVTNPEEQQKVQTSISYIVEDKKNNTINTQIQYLPMSALTNLKIVSKKRFRLLKSIIVDNFKVPFVQDATPQPTVVIPEIPVQPIVNEQPQPLQSLDNASTPVQVNTDDNNVSSNESNVIIDYRTKYFEEEEKNKELQAKIDELTQKLNEIKKVIE